MRSLFALSLLAMLVLMVPQTAIAGDSDAKPFLKMSGFYAFNAYSQNNFFLGKSGLPIEAANDAGDQAAVGGVSDFDSYAIQMFRLMMQFGVENVKAVVRGDLAQGIWGIDNSTSDMDGGFSTLFNNKESNFITHWDWAYIDATAPQYGLNARLGRQNWAVGNRLVVDHDGDGLMVTQDIGDAARFSLGWVKISEGSDGLSDEEAQQGGTDVRDATLYLANYTRKLNDKVEINPFFLFYRDNGYADGRAVLPHGLQYFRARFTPEVTEAMAFGFAAKGSAGPVSFKGEFDFLTGSDDINNLDGNGNLDNFDHTNLRTDVNNGDLSGYNLYVDAKVDAGPGKFGVVFGMGSGDDDLMDGDGNINKIRTSGFFYVNEIWEDSIMPDELGITPQGLGSPASRGYREFENTTLVQANYSAKLHKKVTGFASYTFMKATEAIPEWKTAMVSVDDGMGGTMTVLDLDKFAEAETADDLGSEIDGKIVWNMSPGLAWIFRGGAFFPGDAAAYLINGVLEEGGYTYNETAWELRTTVKFAFDGIKVGG